jgi:hypothetical protein
LLQSKRLVIAHAPKIEILNHRLLRL